MITVKSVSARHCWIKPQRLYWLSNVLMLGGGGEKKTTFPLLGSGPIGDDDLYGSTVPYRTTTYQESSKAHPA